MNEKIVLTADSYDHIDGRNAYQSKIKRLTLGAPLLDENRKMAIAVQIWKETPFGQLEMDQELPIHQVLDLMIFLARSLLYFEDAYRLPLLYDPQKLTVERIGIQGDVMPISICLGNPHLNEDIRQFSQALNDLGEIYGERLRVLARILAEMEF